MKTEIELSENGWMSIRMQAETAQEAAKLVKFAMNADAESRKVLNVYVGDDGVTARVGLNYRKDRRSDRRHKAVERVRVVDHV